MTNAQIFSTFDAWVYIQEYYGGMDLWHGNALKYLHEFYTSHFERGANLKILNYGCGPVVAFEASAAPYAREIVLADYLEQNRAVVNLWLDKDPSRPDFSALDRYVVEELEGLGPDEVEARQDAVRRLVTVCSCDIFQDPPIEKEFIGPYDVVYTASCLEGAVTSLEEYGTAVSKLCELLKPGGWIVMAVCRGTEEGTLHVCYVGSSKFVEIKVREADIIAILQQRCGFERERITIFPLVSLSGEPLASNVEDMMYVIAQNN